MELIYVLIDLLEKQDEENLSKFLNEHTVEKIMKEVEPFDDSKLSILAIKNNSLTLLKYLKKNHHNMNEVDELGMTTYNHLQLRWRSDTIDEFLDSGITEDHNLDKAIELLKKAKANTKLAETDDDLDIIHTYTFDNAKLLYAKQKCVCIYCWEHFESSQIDDFVLSKEGTAICPYCGIESVLGELCGYELNDGLIEKMYDRFFNGSERVSIHATSRIDYLDIE